MSNYTVNEKSKTISVCGQLTDIEKSIIATYIGAGYTVREKKQSNTYRINKADILAYYDEIISDEKADTKAKDAAKAAKDKFNAELEKKYVDKNGKQRKQGFLIAIKWFKSEYKKDYAAIMKAHGGKVAE